jgi:hypothetical protein
MKFFALFFLAATLLCGYFWLTDGPGSGMEYVTPLFAALGGLGLWLDARRRSSVNK